MLGPMHHSSRTVSDIKKSIAFYRDILGFEVVEDISSDEEGIQYASTTPTAGFGSSCSRREVRSWSSSSS